MTRQSGHYRRRAEEHRTRARVHAPARSALAARSRVRGAMIDSPASLLREMQAFQDAGDGELEPVFGDRVRALDPHELLTYLSRTFDDLRLAVWLRLLAFAWQDVPYSTWQRVLEDLADDRRHLYDFLWFAASRSPSTSIASASRIRTSRPSCAARRSATAVHTDLPDAARADGEIVDYESVSGSPRARGRADAGSATRQPRPPRHPRVDGGRRTGARLPGRSHLRAEAGEHRARRGMRPQHSDGPLWVVLCGTEKCCAPRTSVCASDEDESPSVCTRERDGYEIRIVRNRPHCVCSCPEPDPKLPDVPTTREAGFRICSVASGPGSSHRQGPPATSWKQSTRRQMKRCGRKRCRVQWRRWAQSATRDAS